MLLLLLLPPPLVCYYYYYYYYYYYNTFKLRRGCLPEKISLNFVAATDSQDGLSFTSVCKVQWNGLQLFNRKDAVLIWTYVHSFTPKHERHCTVTDSTRYS